MFSDLLLTFLPYYVVVISASVWVARGPGRCSVARHMPCSVQSLLSDSVWVVAGLGGAPLLPHTIFGSFSVSVWVVAGLGCAPQLPHSIFGAFGLWARMGVHRSGRCSAVVPIHVRAFSFLALLLPSATDYEICFARASSDAGTTWVPRLLESHSRLFPTIPVLGMCVCACVFSVSILVLVNCASECFHRLKLER